VSPPEQFDLVVIGAGPAGEKGAAQAAYFGKRVCLIERAPRPGGVAVNTGAIPSKTLRESALHFTGLRQRGLHAIDIRVKPGITIPDFMRRERSVIETEWEIIAQNIERHGITTIQGSARFVDPHTVEVTRFGTAPRLVTAPHFLIATGSVPLAPTGYAVDGEVVVDSDSLLTLQRIPTSMIVVGGGVLGCEFACMFAALGTRVTLVNARSRLISHLDHEAGDVLRQAMTARLDIAVHGNSEIAELQTIDGRAHVTLNDGMTLDADVVLVCTGRAGNAASLGLDQVGVEVDERGFIRVDAQFRTSLPHISAAGDAIGYPALASAAIEQARVAVCHAFELQYKRRVSEILPYAVWTIPEVAVVGQTEEALLARGIACETGRASFRLNPRGQILGATEGFLKLVFHPEDQRLFGVTIVGEGACELIHVGMTVLAFGGTLDYFIQAAFTFPSLTDAYKYAAYDGLQRLQRRVARLPGLPSIARAAVGD
jgi:NAD(P) transhydrogenase